MVALAGCALEVLNVDRAELRSLPSSEIDRHVQTGSSTNFSVSFVQRSSGCHVVAISAHTLVVVSCD